MNQPSRSNKWDQHYAEHPANKPVEAAWVLKQHLADLPLRGKALDLACGLGGNARLLAQCGFKVDAWDISDTALTHLNNWAAVNRLPITPMLCDFEPMLFPYQQYDVIVISRYLNRDLWPQICQALKPHGKLFFQTFLAPVQPHAPKNPAYYLQAGELQTLINSDQAWSNFRLEIYGEGWLTEDESSHRYAWMIAQKRPAQ